MAPGSGPQSDLNPVLGQSSPDSTINRSSSTGQQLSNDNVASPEGGQGTLSGDRPGDITQPAPESHGTIKPDSNGTDTNTGRTGDRSTDMIRRDNTNERNDGDRVLNRNVDVIPNDRDNRFDDAPNQGPNRGTPGSGAQPSETDRDNPGAGPGANNAAGGDRSAK